jgi:hypothetical protein
MIPIVSDRTRRLWDHISRNDEKKVAEMLAIGADVNKTTLQKRNALHLATTTGVGNIEIVKLLLAAGVEVNAKDYQNYTPAQYALWKSKEDLQFIILKILLEKGATVEIKEANELKTPDLRGRELLEGVQYFKGPHSRPENQKSGLAWHSPTLARECANIIGTFTAFYLRTEREMEEIRKKDRSAITAAEPDNSKFDRDKIEYHLTKHIPVSSMLFGKIAEEYEANKHSEKDKGTAATVWKWYHLPANNVSCQPPPKHKGQLESMLTYAVQMEWVKVNLSLYNSLIHD